MPMSCAGKGIGLRREDLGDQKEEFTPTEGHQGPSPGGIMSCYHEALRSGATKAEGCHPTGEQKGCHHTGEKSRCHSTGEQRGCHPYR